MSLLDFRGKMRSLRNFLLPGGDIFLPSFRRVHLKRFRQKDLSRKKIASSAESVGGN